MTCEYLDRPLRELRDYRDEVLAKFDRLTHEQDQLCRSLMHVDNPDAYDDQALAIDALGDEIGILEARLDTLDEYLGHRSDDDPGRPITL